MTDRPERRPARQEREPPPTRPVGGDQGESRVLFTYEDYSGPIPHPRLVSGWEAAIPDGGQRVMAYAEDEAEHRRDMDRQELKAAVSVHRTGQVLTFVLALVIVLSGAWLVYAGYSLVGFGVLLLGAAGLIRAMVRSDSQ